MMQIENQSGEYWGIVDPLPVGWFTAQTDKGKGHVAATLPGMLVEYIAYTVYTGPGSVSTIELYERSTSFGLRRGDRYTGPPIRKCQRTFPATRQGLTDALTYLATVISDGWLAEEDENYK